MVHYFSPLVQPHVFLPFVTNCRCKPVKEIPANIRSKHHRYILKVVPQMQKMKIRARSCTELVSQSATVALVSRLQLSCVMPVQTKACVAKHMQLTAFCGHNLNSCPT